MQKLCHLNLMEWRLAKQDDRLPPPKSPVVEEKFSRPMASLWPDKDGDPIVALPVDCTADLAVSRHHWVTTPILPPQGEFHPPGPRPPFDFRPPTSHPSNMPQDLHLQGHPLRRSAQVLHHLIQVLHQGTSTSMARPRNRNATAGAGIATEGIGTRATARAGNAAEPKKRSGIGALSHRRRRIFGSFWPAFSCLKQWRLIAEFAEVGE